MIDPASTKGKDVLDLIHESLLLLDPAGRITDLNRASESLYGWRAEQVLGQLASELLMGAERIGARRLHELGIVNQVTDSGGALASALALAERLNARAPNALASAKELLGDAHAHTLTQHLAMERDHFVRNLHHANGGEGISAFLEKRAPRYE